MLPGITRRRLLGFAAALPLAPAQLAYAQSDAELLWGGHRALVKDQYDAALKYYRTALQRRSMFAGLDVLIEMVEERQRLGRISPADVHQMVAIYVASVTSVGRDGQTATRPDVTDAQRADWSIYLVMLRKLVEAMSAGNWTLAIEERTATATVPEGSSLKAGNPDHLGLGRWYFETSDSVDTYVTFSNGFSPNFGLARRYPFVEGVLYGPHRGMMELNSPSFVTLLHEFFHVIEWSSGGAIPVAHGFEPGQRKAYPAWTGKAELDYYRWHFAQTLPPLGWKRFNHRTRFTSTPQRSSAALDRVLAAYARIPLSDRQEARRLAADAGKLARSDPPGALALYERALVLSPYAPEALTPLIAYYRQGGRQGDADALAAKLAETQAIAGFVEVKA